MSQGLFELHLCENAWTLKSNFQVSSLTQGDDIVDPKDSSFIRNPHFYNEIIYLCMHYYKLKSNINISLEIENQHSIEVNFFGSNAIESLTYIFMQRVFWHLRLEGNIISNSSI